MKAFLWNHKKLHIWLLSDLCVFAAYFLFRGNRAWMNAITRHITGPIEAALGRLCAHTPVSVMELTVMAAAFCAAAYTAYSIRAVIRAEGRRRERFYTALLGAIGAGLSIQALFCLTWGINFWADSFQDKSGLYAKAVAAEDLEAVTRYFASRVSEAAEGVERDESGVFAVPRAEILAKAPYIYGGMAGYGGGDTAGGIEKIYPFLEFEDIGVKSMLFSRLMSRMDFTGFYCSWTGEANVNTDSPACMLPSTAAHEMAHQRGIASEQECNFIAVLASVESGDPVYAYSGWLMGYLYLCDALYQANPEAYREIRDALPDTVRADLRANNAYWARFENTVIRTVSNTVYDGILKGYGDSRGIRSYGAMVDLLVAYYSGNF